MQTTFYKFKESLFKIFSGRNLFFHLLAILLTAIIVESGMDWKYFVAFNDSAAQSFLFSAAILGGLVPILLPIFLFYISKKKNNASLLNTAYAVTQAAFFGWAISSTYKFFTGRVQPQLHMSSVLDISHNFQFGLYRHGIFWGWPSSHTTVAFAVALTLCMIYPKSTIVRFVTLASALYVGIGVSMSIHWFSDFVAGAIIGTVIGVVVGKAFLDRIKK